MADESKILSVGIDIGTSTTQVIFSRLTFKNSAGYFAVPHIRIVDKAVVYKSDIYMTPLLDRSLIDGSAVQQIVAGEFAKAGYSPADTQTGAVIITGESARKENSEIVLQELSRFAGEFVVSTAGPDLEAIIAGKGSGARQYAEDYQTTVVNLDIGGGTTNAVVFDGEEIIGKGCLDIGGRLIRVDAHGIITYMSESVQKMASSAGIVLNVGEVADYRKVHEICTVMAECLYEWIAGSGSSKRNQSSGISAGSFLRQQQTSPIDMPQRAVLLTQITTPGSTVFQVGKPIRAVCFSGGVADCIYTPVSGDWYRYGDIGPILGQAIRESRLYSDFRIVMAKETIRATVVGAGSYTTSVSGSTITYNRDVFPLKNIPVLKLSAAEQADCFAGDSEGLRERILWMQEQSDSKQLILAMDGKMNPNYLEVKRLAGVLVATLDEMLEAGQPMLVIVKCDMAKALGQMMMQQQAEASKEIIGRQTEVSRDIICIDSIQVEQNDFVDMGKPLVDGLVIPVVVKTLIFG